MTFRTDGERRFVEQMGLAWEQEGVPRIAGRIFGFLLLQLHPSSLEDMASALGVSKASISTDARFLERIGVVERMSRPGDRRDFYTVAPDAPASTLAMRVERMRRMKATLGDLSPLAMDGTPPAVRARLRAFAEAHDETVASLERLIARLRARPAAPFPDQATPAT